MSTPEDLRLDAIQEMQDDWLDAMHSMHTSAEDPTDCLRCEEEELDQLYEDHQAHPVPNGRPTKCFLCEEVWGEMNRRIIIGARSPWTGKCAQCGKPSTTRIIAPPHPDVEFCGTCEPSIWDMKNYRDPAARKRNAANYKMIWGDS